MIITNFLRDTLKYLEQSHNEFPKKTSDTDRKVSDPIDPPRRVSSKVWLRNTYSESLPD